MHGRNGVGGSAPVYDYSQEPYVPVQYPVPPAYPTPAADPRGTGQRIAIGPLSQTDIAILRGQAPVRVAPPTVNPAVRAAGQAQEAPQPQVNPDVRAVGPIDVKSRSDVPHEKGHKRLPGSVNIGGSLLYNKAKLKKELEGDRRTLKKTLPQKEFDRWAHQYLGTYNINKHEQNPAVYGEAAREWLKNWRRMSSEEQDAIIAQEVALKNSPERLAQKAAQQQARQREAQNREMEQQAQQQAARWAAMSPAEQQQVTYNRQLADYNEAVERNQYMDMMPQQQAQPFGQQIGGAEMSPVMLNDLAQMIQGQQTRYVPTRPRRSIHDRVMSSFDPRMFSPEFIPEE